VWSHSALRSSLPDSVSSPDVVEVGPVSAAAPQIPGPRRIDPSVRAADLRMVLVIRIQPGQLSQAVRKVLGRVDAPGMEPFG
jgi:hypothetical protein